MSNTLSQEKEVYNKHATFLRKIYYNLPEELQISQLIDVRSSSKHGRGLFANKDISPHTIVGFYPITFINWSVKDGGKMVSSIGIESEYISQEEIAKQKYEYDQLNRYSISINTIPELQDCHITTLPHIPIRFPFIGHLTNSVMPLSKNSNAEDMMKYVYDTQETNIYFHPIFSGITAIITKQNIKKNEELLMTYDMNFWNNPNNKMYFRNKLYSEINPERYNMFLSFCREQLSREILFANTCKSLEEVKKIKTKLVSLW